MGKRGPALSSRGDEIAAAVANGATISDVSIRYGVHPSVVRRHCQRRGQAEPRQKRKRLERNVEIIEAIKGGVSMTEAATRFGISVSAVSRLCAKNGMQRKIVWEKKRDTIE